MDSFFSNSHNNNKPTTNSNQTHEHKTSTSELFSSAKILAEAAKGGGNQKLDKDKVADAAGDLLCAAQQYGKLDETSAMGKYVHQAEEYLHNYHSSSSSSSSHSSTTTNSTNTSHSAPNSTHINTNTSHSNSGSDGGGSHAESGGYGDYMKMAQGFFKKN